MTSLTVGGAAPRIADTIVRAKCVHLLKELGVPATFWVFQVAGFKGVVTMDASGKSLHAEMLAETKKHRDRLIGV